MIEQTKSSAQDPGRRNKRPIFVLFSLSLVLIFLGYHDFPKLTTGTSSQRVRRNLQQANDKQVQAGQLGELLGDALENVEVDDSVVKAVAGVAAGAAAAIVLVPAALFTACVSAITGGLVLGELLDGNFHRLPSRIEYTLPTTVTIREVSDIEEEQLVNATAAFYEEVLATAFPNELRRVKVVSNREPIDDTTSNPFVIIWDALSGNTRVYGYKWYFTILVGVVDRDNLSLGNVLAAIIGGNMDTYRDTYLRPLQFNIFSSTQTAVYFDELDD